MISLLVISALLSPSAVAQQAADADSDDTDEEANADEPGEVMVVTGSRTERPLSESVVTTDVVTQEQILDSGASDASEVLESVAGVEVVRSFRGAGVRMQGLDPKYVLILVNGQRVPGRRDGVIDLSRIPAERIERIEIVKGAASALYGSDAIAGVINIITREPTEPLSSQTVLSYGSRNTFDASESVGVRREAWRGGLDIGAHGTDGYDWDPSDEQTDGNAVKQGNVEGDIAWKVNPAVRLMADGGYRIRDSRGVDVTTAPLDRRNLTEESTGRGGVEVLASDRTKVAVHAMGSLYRDQYSLDQRGDDDLDVYEDSREVVAQLDGQSDTVLGAHVVSVGAEGLRESLTSPRLSQDGERWRGALFAQDEWRLLPHGNLAVVPSARLDADTWFGLHATPRLATRYDASENFAARASAGWGFRAPDFKEMFLILDHGSIGYIVEGNPELQPETSFGVSAGIETAPVKALTLRLEGFDNELSNLITIDFAEDQSGATADRYTYVNVAEAVTRGGEAALRVRAGRVLTADLGYTYTWTLDREYDRPLDGRPTHRGTFGVTARHPTWLLEGTVRGEVVGPTPFFYDEDGDGTEDTISADPYANLKVRVEKRLLPRVWGGGDRIGPAGVRVFAGVDNLLDAGDALYIHLDPRLVYGGLVFDLPSGDADES